MGAYNRLGINLAGCDVSVPLSENHRFPADRNPKRPVEAALPVVFHVPWAGGGGGTDMKIIYHWEVDPPGWKIKFEGACSN